MSKHQASIVAVVGASGSGKSLSIKQAIARRPPARLLVWDPMREYADVGTVTESLAELFAAVMADPTTPRRSFRLVYRPPSDRETAARAFGALCRVAMIAPRTTLIVEELALVTSPSWAPPGWREATLTGRHQGLRIIAASQRPASVDKDFFGNATRIRCGRLNYDSDLRTMSNVLGVSRDELRDLPPLAYVERDMTTGALSRGVLTV